MFRQMRRSLQQLPREECLAILRRATSGVLALNGDGGYPYAVPLSFVYEGDSLYFHCAASGKSHKLDALAQSDKACFCVTDQDEVAPERYTTRYRSVVVFGRVRRVGDAAEKRAALMGLAGKYNPGDEAGARAEIDRFWEKTAVLRFEAEHLSGKEGLLLAQERRGADPDNPGQSKTVTGGTGL